MNMLKIRKITLIALIPVLLCIYILQIAAGNRTTVSYMTIQDEPDELSIQMADGTEVKLAKENDSWVIGNQKYPADASKVTSLVSSLTSVKVLETVSSSTSDLERYGLDDSTAMVVKLSREGKTLRTFKIGKASATAKQTYITADDGKDILLASGTFSSDFAVTADDLRNKSVYSLDSASITSVRFYTPDSGESSLTKDQETGTWPNDDSSMISSWISGLSSLTVQSWAPDDTELPQEEAGRVSLVTADRTVTVKVYATEDDSKYLASCSETPYAFYLSSYTGGRFIKTAQDFQ